MFIIYFFLCIFYYHFKTLVHSFTIAPLPFLSLRYFINTKATSLVITKYIQSASPLICPTRPE